MDDAEPLHSGQSDKSSVLAGAAPPLAGAALDTLRVFYDK